MQVERISMNDRSSLALAAVFHGTSQPFELDSFPIPAPGDGEILVAITCATICGSDVHTWHGRRNEPTPCVLGHEITGRITAFGKRAPRQDLRGEPLSPGDRVTWTLAASCGTCFFCTRGLPQKCSDLFKYGHSAISPGREFSGGFAEYCLLRPGTGVLRIPDAVPDELAAPANCAVATTAAAFRLGGSAEGAVVAVIGCGVLGLHACAMASAAGAAAVIACDRVPELATAARRFGATAFAAPEELLEMVRDSSAGRGADLVLEFSGSSAAVAAALGSMRTGATAVIAGTILPSPPVMLDPQDLVRRMLTVKGLHNYVPQDLMTAVDFIHGNLQRFPFTDLSAESFTLPEIDRAFEAAAASSGRRVSIRMNPSES